MLKRKRLGLFSLLTVFYSLYLAINTCVVTTSMAGISLLPSRWALGGLQTVHCIALPPIVEQSRASGQQVR